MREASGGTFIGIREVNTWSRQCPVCLGLQPSGLRGPDQGRQHHCALFLSLPSSFPLGPEQWLAGRPMPASGQPSFSTHQATVDGIVPFHSEDSWAVPLGCRPPSHLLRSARPFPSSDLTLPDSKNGALELGV